MSSVGILLPLVCQVSSAERAGLANVLGPCDGRAAHWGKHVTKG